MTTSALAIVLSAALPSLLDSPAVELRYTGTLTPARVGNSGEPVKRFSLYCLYIRETKGGSLSFVVEEQGGGGWPWPERFGRIALDEQHRPLGKTRMRLLHTHEGTKYPLTIRQPLFDSSLKLAENAQGKEGQTRWEVTRRRKVGERPCWQVDVSGRSGRSQRVFVPVNSPIVVQFQQVVFVGRGERMALRGELQSAAAVDAARLAKLRKPLDELLKLQSALKRRENETRPELGADQLALVAQTLKTLDHDAQATPFHRLVTFIKGDLESQQKRGRDVEKLAKQIVGKPAPKLSLQGLDGKAIDPRQHAGRIVVLHFWEYRAEPLEEPYGQVGYLDYLHAKRRKLGVQIYGVAVDRRLAQAETALRAQRSIRKLKEFMNLSYPVTLDDGTLIRRFGDPRTADAKLPLWIVIDQAGKVRLYKAGFYQVRPDEGLRPLDELLIRLIREQRKDR